MIGAASRAKGRRGQTEAANLLKSRDWTVADLTSGASSEDFIAVDPNGISWSVEVKNTVAITVAHRKQAQEQARKRKLPWMLMSKIHGTSEWLIQRQYGNSCVWRRHVCGILAEVPEEGIEEGSGEVVGEVETV